MVGSNDALLGSGPTFDQSVPLPPLMMYDLAQPCCRASHPRSPRHSCLVQSSSAMIPLALSHLPARAILSQFSSGSGASLCDCAAFDRRRSVAISDEELQNLGLGSSCSEEAPEAAKLFWGDEELEDVGGGRLYPKRSVSSQSSLQLSILSAASSCHYLLLTYRALHDLDPARGTFCCKG